MKKDIKEAEKLISHLTTLTALLIVLITCGAIILVYYACINNNVFLLVLGCLLFLLDIPLSILGSRADNWRFA